MDQARGGWIGQRHRDDVHEVAERVLQGGRQPHAAARAARVVAVDDQVPAVDPSHGDRVRAAGQLERSEKPRTRRVADVEDVNALESRRHGSSGALAGLRPLRVPAAHEDVVPHHQVALVAVAHHLGDQPRVAGRSDVDDAETVVRSLVGQFALEREVTADTPLPLWHIEGRDTELVTHFVDVARVRIGVLRAGWGRDACQREQSADNDSRGGGQGESAHQCPRVVCSNDQMG